jgi:hypothetical protein
MMNLSNMSYHYSLQKIESCILQNNSVNIFEEYFDGLEPAPIVDRSSARTMYVYKDVESPTVSVTVSSTTSSLINNEYLSHSVLLATYHGHRTQEIK